MGTPSGVAVHMFTFAQSVLFYLSSSELLRRCKESDAAGEEPDRGSEEQAEANSESGQSAPGEKAFPFLQHHTRTQTYTHTHTRLVLFNSISLYLQPTYYNRLRIFIFPSRTPALHD